MRPTTRRRLRIAAYLPLIAGVALAIAAMSRTSDPGSRQPNLSHGIDAVHCNEALATANAFSRAAEDATTVTPDYAKIRDFGLAPPVNPGDVVIFRKRMADLRQALNAKAESVRLGTCDRPTAQVLGADGRLVTLPLVSNERRTDDPLSGSESNADPRTPPVSVGLPSDRVRTSSWGELDRVFGDQSWYRDCANRNLGMRWDSDVPKFVRTEKQGRDSRFILVVNSPLKDPQVRKLAAADGNPNVSKLEIVRVKEIVNTRHLGEKRCDPFVDQRSQIRVTLGRVLYNRDGSFKGIEQAKGAFVDCHNLWQIPKKVTPTPTSTPSSRPSSPATSRPPTSTPPTTQPPATCTPPETGTPPNCLQPKDGRQGPVHQGNIPTQVQGENPPPARTAEPRPTTPPHTYVPPPPPTSSPPSTRTTAPPPPPSPEPTSTVDPCHPVVTPACD